MCFTVIGRIQWRWMISLSVSAGGNLSTSWNQTTERSWGVKVQALKGVDMSVEMKVNWAGSVRRSKTREALVAVQVFKLKDNVTRQATCEICWNVSNENTLI